MKQLTAIAFTLLVLCAQAQTPMQAGNGLESKFLFQNFVQYTAGDTNLFTGISGTNQWYNFIKVFQATDALCNKQAATSDNATFDQTAEDRMYMDCLNTAPQCGAWDQFVITTYTGVFSPPAMAIQACYDYCSPLADAGSAGVKAYAKCYKAGLDAVEKIAPTIYDQINPTEAAAGYAANDSTNGFNANGARVAQCVASNNCWSGYSEFSSAKQGPFWKTLHASKVTKITAECTGNKALGATDKPNDTMVKCLRGALKYGYEQDMDTYRCLLQCVAPPNFLNRGNGKQGKSDGESELKDLDGELINARLKLFTDLGACLDAQFQLTWENKAFSGRVDGDGQNFPQWSSKQNNHADYRTFDMNLGGDLLQKWTKGVRNCLAFSDNCVGLRNQFQTRGHLNSEYGDHWVQSLAKKCADKCINDQAWLTDFAGASSVYTNAETYYRGNHPAVQSDLEKGKACFATFTKGITLNGRSLFSSNGSILILGTIITLVFALVF